MRLSRALVGHFPGSLAQINVLLSVFFAGISGSSTADAASQSKLFIDAQTKRRLRAVVLDRDHGGVGSAGGDHPAVDPDGGVGRRHLDFHRCALSRRHHSRPADRRRADGHGARLRQAVQLPGLSAGIR